MQEATASTAYYTMTSTTSFDIDSEYCIDDLCKLVLENSEYQQPEGSSESTTKF
jgi:hypothetical protein